MPTEAGVCVLVGKPLKTYTSRENALFLSNLHIYFGAYFRQVDC